MELVQGTCMRARTHTHIHTHTMHARTCTHTNTHTHTLVSHDSISHVIYKSQSVPVYTLLRQCEFSDKVRKSAYRCPFIYQSVHRHTFLCCLHVMTYPVASLCMTDNLLSSHTFFLSLFPSQFSLSVCVDPVKG